MTATISSTEKSRKRGLTTIWLPERGAPAADVGAAGDPAAGSWKTESTSDISSSANRPSDIGSPAGSSAGSVSSTSISSASSALPVYSRS